MGYWRFSCGARKGAAPPLRLRAGTACEWHALVRRFEPELVGLEAGRRKDQA
jgi:hypothetical protein